jgi:RimJ/RimL family protein N-acetyltransferase
MLKPLQLHTPRLRLRPATALDRDALQPWGPEATSPHWREQAHASGGVGLWVIALADGAQDIGAAGVWPSAMAPSLCGGRGEVFEPQLWLRREHRGHGYAQEAMKAVLWHAQSATRGRCFVAVCDVPNVAADRWLRRLGFVPGYEAEGEHSRVRQYRLPSMPQATTP